MKLKLFLLSSLILGFFGQSFAQKKIRTLIIDGQNNHAQWPKVTYMMKNYLEESGRFEVDVNRTAFTWKGEAFIAKFLIKGTEGTEALDESKTDPNFRPEFSEYDLVICNFGWNAAPWTEETQTALDKFVKKGGGFVVLHAADNSFPKWLAYNEMIGLGGWGDRSEKDGPYVYYSTNDELQRDMSPGKGGSHGSQHEFTIQIRDSAHPITAGMPLKWLHTKDELYDRLRGPAKNMKVLATAFSSEEANGTNRHEPMLMTIDYGKGRVFHTPMGHVDYSVACVGFITCLLRGSEWAATGKVTLPIPSDFPTEMTTSSRVFESSH
jgi:type 1 glutamine amidotransferase